MRFLIALASFFLLAPTASAKNYGQGEVATYVPIPTYGQITAEWDNCNWKVDLSAKQIGGRKIELGQLNLYSPYLCKWVNDYDNYARSKNVGGLSFYTVRPSPPNIEDSLKKEATRLNSFVEAVADSLSGKVGASTLVYSFHFKERGQDWYYTGAYFSGKLLSYGWQKVPDKNYAYYYYNSTSGRISDQAPKPTDKPDALPVLNSTDSSKLAQKANYLNSKVRGGCEEEVYKNGARVAHEFHKLGGRYDTFAETYVDKTCSGKEITYQASDYGRGITAFEKNVAVPDLQRRGLTSGVVAFFYSPTVYSLEDKVVERKLSVSCPPGYSFVCYKNACEKGSSAAKPTFYLTENHEITAHLSRDVRIDLITADGKSSLLETATLRLPDYKYHVKVKGKIPASTFKTAVNYAKTHTLLIDDCSFGKFRSGSPQGAKLSVPKCPPPPPPPPPPKPKPKPKPKASGAGKVVHKKLTYKEFVELYEEFLRKHALAQWVLGYSTTRCCRGAPVRIDFTWSEFHPFKECRLKYEKGVDRYLYCKLNGRYVSTAKREGAVREGEITSFDFNDPRHPKIVIVNSNFCIAGREYIYGKNRDRDVYHVYCGRRNEGGYIVYKKDLIDFCNKYSAIKCVFKDRPF